MDNAFIDKTFTYFRSYIRLYLEVIVGSLIKFLSLFSR